MSRPVLLEAVRSAYERAFGAVPANAIAALAPGRVNLIGEHTDYTGGSVLPMAIDRGVMALAAPAGDGTTVSVYADRFRDLMTLSIAPEQSGPIGTGWQRYVVGVVRELQAIGIVVPPVRLAIVADLADGAGLSSSAALEVAVATALLHLAGTTIEPEQVALLCQRAEHRWAGVPCGIMDQFAVTLAQPGCALWLATDTRQYRHVPIDTAAARVVVVHSGVDRTLASSAYSQRRQECHEALRLLASARPGLSSLGALSSGALAGHRHLLPDPIARRVRHVVSENERVAAAVAALDAGDLATFGQLMNESHRSLRDDYEVSCAELDLLVELAHGMPGVLGSRLTGAGFGGCTVSLVRADAVEAFVSTIPVAYEAKTGLQAQVWVTDAVGGVGLVDVGRGGPT